MAYYHVKLARQAVEDYIRKGEIISPPSDTPPELLKERLGVFITILQKEKDKDKKTLRGCIGTYLPTKINIAEEIIYNAIAAARDDYRFDPIKEEELDSLSYLVYVIHDPHLINSLDQLNPNKFGLLVKTTPFTYPNKKPNHGEIPFKSGLLLPGLDGIDTPKQQFDTACRKAGIDPEKEKVYLYRFNVDKYL